MTEDLAAEARHLLRAQPAAVLATAFAGDGEAQGWPYASLVLTACTYDASPLLLISRLAEHTRNLERDNRASLLFDGTAGLAHRLTGARLTVLGRARRTDDAGALARFTARHEDAASYASFADFGLFRLEIERAHLVAGFGRIHWLEGAALRFDAKDSAPLAEAEADIVAHMNAHHAATVEGYATSLLGLDGSGWTMTGCDPEGCDLRRPGASARLRFAQPVATPEQARAALVALAA